MSKIISIEPAIDPNARPTFLLDWELTLKCNLDCSYCPTDYHDNSTDHPPKQQCFETIDFMLAYVDLYMEKKPSWSRSVVLNVYGGESLFHPDIVEILTRVRQQHRAYQDRWPLTVTCTTNGVVGRKRMSDVAKLIDEFTVSYHAESLIKQKQQVRDNLLLLKKSNRRVKCVVLMHGNESHWPELLEHIEFCKNNDIRYLPRQLDGNKNSNYNTGQITWFQNMWAQRSPNKSVPKQIQMMEHKNLREQEDATLSDVGRACCGGRLMCTNSDMKHPVFYMPDNNFHGWQCSVNWFFLYIKQYTKEVFVNKDCRMDFHGNVGPIGHLDQASVLLAQTKQDLEGPSPVIECKKQRCVCGLCAPKAQSTNQYIDIMRKHVTPDVTWQI